MAIAANLRTHRHWEDWLSMVLGVGVAISPWLLSDNAESGIVLNALFVGLAIYGVSALELQVLRPWEEWLNLALGLWLICSPFVLGYGGVLAAAHHGIGALVAGLAALELWQDRRRDAAAD